MSGGRLVMVDQAGRDMKQYVLTSGLAVLGSDSSCDIHVALPGVAPHHATIIVQTAETMIRTEGGHAMLVNGREADVASLRHRDVITVGGRALRWEYNDPRATRNTSSTGGKQVAIVQPQRRDNSDQTDKSPSLAYQQAASRRSHSVGSSETENWTRKSSLRTSPKHVLQNTTKATLWIESRKTSPRKKAQSTLQVRRSRKSLPANKTTPLRLTVLKKAQSAKKVIKIEAPLTIDHTKQAAIMLMTGHTPKFSFSPKNQPTAKKSPAYVIKKPSPVRKTPRGKGRQSGRRSKVSGSDIRVTPSRGSTFAQDISNARSSKKSSGNPSVSVLEITDSTQNSTIRASNISTRSGKSPQKSFSLLSPKKSSMKDHSKKSTRKTESIKFDLSNLETSQGSNDVTDPNTTQCDSDNSISEEDLTLHYSESSNQSPSPRKSIHSRSSRSSKMFANLGTSLTPTITSPSRTLTLESPLPRKSIRGSSMVQKALETSTMSDYTKAYKSGNTTVASAFRTRTLSPRSTQNMESYSVVDLVSFDSNDTSKSVYNSAGSVDTIDFGTPQDSSRRKTRSTINPTLLSSSTPYVGGHRATRSKSSSNMILNKSKTSSVSTRRSKSLSTPENKYISVNSTKRSRASRSRSRINDSDLLLLDDTEVEDSSPKTSKRTRTTRSIVTDISNVNVTENSPENQGVSTPPTRDSPEEIGTPVLSIQSLLNSSQSSLTSQNSGRRGKRSANYNRKTIGVLSGPKKRQDSKSKSLGSSIRKTWLRLSNDSGASSDKTDEGAQQPNNDKVVTPKSTVNISPEAVKNKHSTAKKPQSKRSIIDDLNQSDIVKQLFNSPVKRKLSQSMTEFSRKQLFDDDSEIVLARRPTRNTVALMGTTPDNSLLNQTESITPERFVSPIQTPGNSPNSSGLKRLFKKTPRTRASIKNDLTKVHSVKAVIATSPQNRLSDVPVKRVFVVSPKNDLRRVSGVKSLFQKKSPKNDLTDVSGVKKMFQRKSPENDYRNVSGVKRTLRNTTPKNDLTDVRGVKRMFQQEEPKDNYHDVSGIEELLDESNQSGNKSETLFDKLVGKPPIKSVYSKTFSTKLIQKPKTRQTKSLHNSIDVITSNVEEWLEHELQKRLHKDAEPSTSPSILRNSSKNATIRELQKLATDTLEGGEPFLASRTRNSSYKGKRSASQIYSSHILPIKKRSLQRVEASLEKSKHKLPIKKRAVVHSTPVKGRANLTMNASELGRVSPIAAVAHAAGARASVGDNTTVARSYQTVTDDNSNGKPSRVRTPRKQETPKKIEISKSMSKKSPDPSPPKRTTRNRKIMDNTKKLRNSVVITKKAPVINPQSDLKATSAMDFKEFIKVSPKKTRATRGKTVQRNSIVITKKAPIINPQADLKAASATDYKEFSEVSAKKTRTTRSKKIDKSETPKRTRARATKATVVSKQSPKNPKKSETKERPNKRKAQKTAAVKEKVGSHNIPPTVNRKTRAIVTENEPQTTGRKSKEEKPTQSKRGRKAAEIEQPVQPKRSRKTTTVATSVQENIKTRTIKTAVIAPSKAEEKQPKARGKQVAIQASVQSESTTRGRKRVEPAVSEIQPRTRGRKIENSVNSEVIKTKSRGKKAETPSVPEPLTRAPARKAEQTALPETKRRKRKAAAIEELPAKLAKAEPKRGRKANASVTVAAVVPTTDRRKKATTNEKSDGNSKQETQKSTRGARSKQVVEIPTEIDTKKVKGRKAAEPKAKVVETARGKRKANVEPSPVKVAAKKPATKATIRPAPSPPKKRVRFLRGKPQPEAPSEVAGRSRRR